MTKHVSSFHSPDYLFQKSFVFVDKNAISMFVDGQSGEKVMLFQTHSLSSPIISGHCWLATKVLWRSTAFLRNCLLHL